MSQRSPLAKSKDYGFVTPSQLCVTHVHIFNRFGIPGDSVLTVLVALVHTVPPVCLVFLREVGVLFVAAF